MRCTTEMLALAKIASHEKGFARSSKSGVIQDVQLIALATLMHLFLKGAEVRQDGGEEPLWRNVPA